MKENVFAGAVTMLLTDQNLNSTSFDARNYKWIALKLNLNIHSGRLVSICLSYGVYIPPLYTYTGACHINPAPPEYGCALNSKLCPMQSFIT